MKLNELKEADSNWLPQIPKHWTIKKLKRCCQVKRGASPRPISDPVYFDDKGEYGWVRISDVTKSSKYLISTEQTLSQFGTSYSVKMEVGDLFLSIAGSVGKPIITKIKCCIHDGFVWFKNLKEIEKEFLYYVFLSGECFGGLGKIGTQLNLNTDTIGMISIPIPPPKEQNAIVEYLDRKNAQIDTFIAKKQRLIELLEEERKGKIKACYTNGLTKGTILQKTGEDWVEKIPAHWEFKKLRHIANHVQRGSSPNYIENSELVVISQAAISSGFIDDTKFKFQQPDNIENFKGRLFNGDLLIASTGGGVLGKTIVFNRDGNYIADGHITIIRDSKNRFNPYFLFYLFSINYDFIEGYLGQGSTNQTELQRQWLRDLFLPYPSLEEQNEIVDHIEKISAEIDLAILKAQKEIAAIQEYRQALIAGLVTGKYQVPQLQTATA